MIRLWLLKRIQLPRNRGDTKYVAYFSRHFLGSGKAGRQLGQEAFLVSLVIYDSNVHFRSSLTMQCFSTSTLVCRIGSYITFKFYCFVDGSGSAIFLCNLRIMSDDLRLAHVSSFCTFVSFLFPECCWCFCNFCREGDSFKEINKKYFSSSRI